MFYDGEKMYFEGARMIETPDVAPLRNSPDDLYQHFIDVQKSYSQVMDDESTPYELANQYELLTDVNLKVLMDLKKKRSLTEGDSLICKKLEVLLNEERNTWRLTKALVKEKLFNESDISRTSDCMDDSGEFIQGRFSEEQMIVKFYLANREVLRMQTVADWLEANEAIDMDYKDEDDKVEFYSEGPNAWEETFHAMRANYKIDIPYLDITLNPNAGVELCSSMDPDAPIRTKKSLAHGDKETEIKLFKQLFRFVRAGKLDEGQEMAQRVGYQWLSAILDGWLPFSDPNLDGENMNTNGLTNHEPSEVGVVRGNRKRDIWKQTCFRTAKMHGLTSCEKAVLGLLGGNLKSVLPVCNTWSDQLWARLRCSIDVLIEKALRDPNNVPQENRELIDYPQEFYDNYQDIPSIFKSIKDLKILAPFKEAIIHQTIQRYLILNDIDGLLNQLEDWCATLDFDNNLAENDGAVSPQFLRFFAHIVLFLREINLVAADDSRGTKIIEAYICLLTQMGSIESVAHYTVSLPRDNQVVSYAKLLATINDREDRMHCLNIARDSKLDVDEITQTVVEIIMKESPNTIMNENNVSGFNNSMSELESTKTSVYDRRKIEALDYLLYLDSRNYVAILHHGNVMLRHFALQRKMDAVKETFLKLPVDLNEHVERQWRVHTNGEITPSLRNNIRELDCFRVILGAQEELAQWSEWHHKKPEEPRKPANLSKFCDNVNYEQRIKQYQQDFEIWKGLRLLRTNSLTDKISELFYFPHGWMIDLPADGSTEERRSELARLRRIFVPHWVTVCFNVLQLTNRYEDCLKVSHIIARDDLALHKEFTKAQLRDFLDKICEVTKIIVKKSITEA